MVSTDFALCPEMSITDLGHCGHSQRIELRRAGARALDADTGAEHLAGESLGRLGASGN